MRTTSDETYDYLETLQVELAERERKVSDLEAENTDLRRVIDELRERLRGDNVDLSVSHARLLAGVTLIAYGEHTAGCRSAKTCRGDCAIVMATRLMDGDDAV